MQLVRRSLPFFFLILLAGSVVAQSPQAAPDTADQIAQLQQQVADAKSSADNAWMLVSSALVLMMTGPGLALFYGGLVRKKNVLATMMQSFAMMARHHRAVGDRASTACASPRETASSAASAMCSCAVSERSPTPTTPPPSRSRPS